MQFSNHQTVSFSIVLCTCNFILSYLFRSADLGNPNICMELLLSTRQNLKANIITAQVNKNHELSDHMYK